MNPVGRFLRYGVPFLAYAGFIYYLSSQSSLPIQRTHPELSTYAHVLEYLGFGILGARGLCGYGLSIRRSAGVAVLLCSLYGGTDELHQRYTPRRVPDVMDWVADTVGASIGCTVWFLVKRRRERSTLPGHLPDHSPELLRRGVGPDHR